MATLVDQEFFARLNALNDKFAASVPDTLARLRGHRQAFDPEQPDPDVIKELRQMLHTIAGSAATFGFRVFGQEARNLEQRLRVLTAFDTIAADDWRRWLEALDEYLAWSETDPRAEQYPGSPRSQ
jgi:HPt (histidine-containing phosphotransfer) domain-containing protein